MKLNIKPPPRPLPPWADEQHREYETAVAFVHDNFEHCLELLLDADGLFKSKLELLQNIVFESKDRSWTFDEAVVYYLSFARPRKYKKICQGHAKHLPT